VWSFNYGRRLVEWEKKMLGNDTGAGLERWMLATVTEVEPDYVFAIENGFDPLTGNRDTARKIKHRKYTRT
jgi:hypothetical protein